MEDISYISKIIFKDNLYIIKDENALTKDEFINYMNSFWGGAALNSEYNDQTKILTLNIDK